MNRFEKFVEYWKGTGVSHETLLMRRVAVALQSILLVMVLSIGYIFYLNFIDVSVPVEILNEPFPVLTETVHQGELLIFETELCRNDTSEVDFQLSWYRPLDNGRNFGEKYVGVKGVEGCYTIRPEYTVPDLVPGIYYLVIDVTYNTNWMHSETITMRTQEFEVLPK